MIAKKKSNFSQLAHTAAHEFPTLKKHTPVFVLVEIFNYWKKKEEFGRESHEEWRVSGSVGQRSCVFRKVFELKYSQNLLAWIENLFFVNTL